MSLDAVEIVALAEQARLAAEAVTAAREVSRVAQESFAAASEAYNRACEDLGKAKHALVVAAAGTERGWPFISSPREATDIPDPRPIIIDDDGRPRSWWRFW